MRPAVPSTLQKYSESPLFDQDTVPDALLRDHNTKAGVWGLIVVSEGALTYLRDAHPAQIVTADAPAVIYPEEPHSVHPKGKVRFKVEFYRLPKEGEAE
ncbi:tellurite resistance protein TehB [Tritonibacter multivorans]|uniref:Tellurite resistance protein TehB n=1 Tax=Tritonibacter multivorans TaxID=928856 RepID=A0A0P1GAR3_9RHOB|nr:DUF1971 domain-containing protein [Tritonibacter multivorans]MDA7422104.1 DUF1971 domain-containing protein [Tritonibacter multivorans]CUH78461.1 tellurite resistance protein TehB [Tritonibacter multivorans]SFD17233.1 Uncharacterized protein, possibly involved in tellurite resistance [Tritonibacter multivorans]